MGDHFPGPGNMVETVADVLREMAAIPFHSEVYGETVQDFAARIEAAHTREVERAVANERVRDVHTCHDQCTKTELCRMTRRAEAAEAYIREADRRISVLASLLNQANVDRLREVEALRAEVASASEAFTKAALLGR